MDLASKTIKRNSRSFWKKNSLTDNEDIGYMHRWSWAVNLIYSKRQIKKQIKKYIENVINNWFFENQNSSY